MQVDLHCEFFFFNLILWIVLVHCQGIIEKQIRRRDVVYFVVGNDIFIYSLHVS